MANGITLSVASDTRAAAQGLKRGLIEPLEDTRDVLGRVEHASDDATTKLETGFRDAQAATKRYAAENAATTRAIVGDAKRQEAATTAATQHATAEHSAAMSEVRAEAIANASETFSSFDGSVSGLLGGIQGTFGGLVASLGPLGMAVGAAGAVGIGLIQTALENGDTASQEFRDSVSELGAELIDQSRNGSVALSTVVEQLKTLATESDQSKDSLAKLGQIADRAGGSYKDLAQAFAGNQEGLERLRDRTRQAITATEAAAAAANTHTAAGQAEYASSIKRAAGLREYAGKLDEAARKVAGAAEQEQAWKDAGGPDLAQKAADAETYAGSLQSALADAGADWERFADKEGGVNLDKYEREMELKVKAIEDYQRNIVTASSQMSEDARSYLISLGTDAAPLLEKFVHAPAKQRGAIAKQWDILGKAAQDSFVTGIENNMPTIKAPKVARPVVPAPDMSRVDAALRQSKDLRVVVGYFTNTGRRII